MWRTVLLCTAALLGLAVLPVAAQSGVVWNAEFFNNSYLLPPARLVRQDTAIAFNWGSTAPAPNVNADGFTVRWGTDVFLPAGTYRFWALADDAVRVIVDYQFAPLIDTFPQPRVGQIVSADITLNAGVHHIQVDYAEAGGDAYVFVTWADLATNPSGPNFPPLGASGLSAGPWTAQYYANATLSGTPTLIQTESSPTHNWGTSSPVASIPADNFSARWTSTLTLEAGTYQISAHADDGVRVYVDGRPVIDQFGPATGQVYTASLTLGAGQHNFMVEYLELGGLAFLDFTLTRQGTAPPVSGPAATVTGAFRLNVRAAPDPVNGAVLTQIRRNETYPIVGRNADTSWWQINVNGLIGWVNARFVTAFNTQNVPVTSGAISQPTATPTPVITGAAATVTGAFRLNVRAAPDPVNGAVLTQIRRNETYPIVGRNADTSWWQINVNGLIGWVNARFVTAMNTQNVPVTFASPPPTGTTPPIVQCSGFLPSRLAAGRQGRVLPGLSNNFRDQPFLTSNIIGRIPGGAVFTVVAGPLCSSNIAWWQVNYNGVIGWTAEGRGNVYWLEPVS